MVAVRRVAKSSSFRFRCCCSFLQCFFLLLKFSHICICRIASCQSHNQAMLFCTMWYAGFLSRLTYVRFASIALEVLPSLRLSRFSFSSKMHFVGFGVRLSTLIDVLFMSLAWLTVPSHSLSWRLNFGVVLAFLFGAFFLGRPLLSTQQTQTDMADFSHPREMWCW